VISVYADGSSHSKGGMPGGWAYVVVRDDYPLLAGSGAHPATTNNVMELMGAAEGLKAVLARGWHEQGELIELVSDSQYALGIASGGYTPIKNLELARELREIALKAGARCRWVPGHTGDTWNERCDSLAHDAKQTLVPEKVKKKQAAKKAKKERARGTA
jgi:ribonuclease HI